MNRADIHTHSTFSYDGHSSLADMISAAKAQKMRYFGVAEHFDYDCVADGVLIYGKPVPPIDAKKYFSAVREMQRTHNTQDFTLLAGGEFGFSPTAQAQENYFRVAEEFSPDFIVNSVHTLFGFDCYFAEAFEGKTKSYAYGKYLERVRESLDAPYRYDIVAHLGYASRNAPYEDKKFRYKEFSSLFDDILSTIIAKKKILEVNSSSKGAGSEWLPDRDVLSRYFELGGRRVCFASDAHDVARVGNKFDLVVNTLKQIGFSYLTVPINGKEIQLEV